jgi:tRNA nucleotidyltransferase/poly(A) polymerase
MSTIEILQRLDKETKAEVFVVGGFVRDYLRNKNNLDLDIVIRNLPLRNIKKFLQKYGILKEICLSKTNSLFEVNIILFKAFEDQIEAQITLPRRSKRQIPDLSNTLQQDVKFRDFKINALYLPINYTSKKDIIDLVGGKVDIIKKRLSSNGSPNERIKESPIRMLRAISLAARTNYTIDYRLLNAIKINASLINKCPVEVIRTEFNKILMSDNPSKYLCILKDTDLLEHISPEINSCIGVKQDDRYHKYDVFHHLVYTVDNCDKDIVLRLAGLLHDIGKPETMIECREKII